MFRPDERDSEGDVNRPRRRSHPPSYLQDYEVRHPMRHRSPVDEHTRQTSLQTHQRVVSPLRLKAQVQWQSRSCITKNVAALHLELFTTSLSTATALIMVSHSISLMGGIDPNVIMPIVAMMTTSTHVMTNTTLSTEPPAASLMIVTHLYTALRTVSLMSGLTLCPMSVIITAAVKLLHLIDSLV
ncbi:Hypothetical predicted protein [Scomber scombrus]|uniref:Uncharacterized protein n=1 Tax=Scomber scombrus TaxID=13677 RepID=A0AAV1N9Y6_SCOSC